VRKRSSTPPEPEAPPLPSRGEMASAAVREFWGGRSSPSQAAYAAVGELVRKCDKAELALLLESIPYTTGDTEAQCRRMRHLVSGALAEK
jgi:hypothetical protein